MANFQHQLDQALGLVRAYRDFTSALATWSKPLGLSADACLIIMLLRATDGPSNTELAASLSLNLATATKIIDRLVSDNLVHRKPHATDRRRIQIHLTADGRVAADKAAEIFGRFMQDGALRDSAMDGAGIA